MGFGWFLCLFFFKKLMYATASKIWLSRCSVEQICKTLVDQATFLT